MSKLYNSAMPSSKLEWLGERNAQQNIQQTHARASYSLTKSILLLLLLLLLPAHWIWFAFSPPINILTNVSWILIFFSLCRPKPMYDDAAQSIHTWIVCMFDCMQLEWKERLVDTSNLAVFHMLKGLRCVGRGLNTFDNIQDDRYTRMQVEYIHTIKTHTEGTGQHGIIYYNDTVKKEQYAIRL